MSKKLLALDIDGTLTNTQKDITPATLEKIIEAQEKGHIVAIASGRPLPGIRKIADTIELDRFGGYVLAFNGGRIVDYSTGEVVPFCPYQGPQEASQGMLPCEHLAA